MNRIVLIAGPTASGKSALALALAKAHNGVVINADSMQVYRDLPIITARPTPEEEGEAPHRLYGHVDAAVNYSVGQWCRDVAATLDEVRAAGLLPILVGGTGLYFKALTEGMSEIPAIPEDVRAVTRARVNRDGVEAMYADLQRLDPASAARIMPRDRARITRALEVLHGTCRTLTEWHEALAPPLIDPGTATKLFLTCERAPLVDRITARFQVMLAAGAIEEVQALASRGLDPLLPAMKAHGVPALIKHLRGELTLAEAAEVGAMDTRRYAKRQNTWFRNQMHGWRWVIPEDAGAFVRHELQA